MYLMVLGVLCLDSQLGFSDVLFCPFSALPLQLLHLLCYVALLPHLLRYDHLLVSLEK